MTTSTHRSAVIAATIVTAATASVVLCATASAVPLRGNLQVTTTTAPAWVRHHALPVAIVVRNPNAQLFCDQFTLTLSSASRGVERSLTVTARATDGMIADSVMLPARWVHHGKLVYTVTARQTCGLLDSTQTYAGEARGSSHIA